ncbi:MAG TPA: Uma2 family endonuclease [Chthoniobacteraceae bacterium]|jgi:Uma2 family endonuclease|nr:Uma2 family endonuclease [Chthoniobacteraceae bacterium]
MPEVLEPLEARSPAADEAEPASEEARLVVRFPPGMAMDEEQLYEFCAINTELRIERNATGEIIIMSPENISSGAGSSEAHYQVFHWAKRDGTGRVFGSSAGFTLSNTAMRAPDVSWVRKDRLRKLPKREWERFAHICPDFVLELRSKSDSLRVLKAKMVEYLENGAQLGWLLDPRTRAVYIYRPEQPVEELRAPAQLSGETVLPGFVLDVEEVWKAMEF